MQSPGVAMLAPFHLKSVQLARAGNFLNVNQNHSEWRRVGSASKMETS